MTASDGLGGSESKRDERFYADNVTKVFWPHGRVWDIEIHEFTHNGKHWICFLYDGNGGIDCKEVGR